MSPDQPGLQVADCSCGCCHTTYRTPDEMEQGGTVFLKCAVDEVQSKSTAVATSKDLNGKVSTESLSCKTSCMPPKAEEKAEAKAEEKEKGNSTEPKSIFQGSGGGGLPSPIDYNRYCFYNCRPYDFTVGNICVSLGKKLSSKVKGDVDPALHPRVTDPEVQKAWAQSLGVEPKPTEAPTTTTVSLPCEESDPCAYKMMDASIKNSTMYLKKAQDESRNVARIAKMGPKL